MTVIRIQPNPHWTMWLEARCTPDLDINVAEGKGLFEMVRFDVYVGWEAGGAREATERHIGAFFFSPMPGCCGVVVSHGSFLNNTERGSNLGEFFHDLKAEVARRLGYTCMLATTRTDNFPEVIGASKKGWKMHEAFTNPRTRNQLVVMEKHL